MDEKSLMIHFLAIHFLAIHFGLEDKSPSASTMRHPLSIPGEQLKASPNRVDRLRGVNLLLSLTCDRDRQIELK
jgi:hypothetical protein